MGVQSLWTPARRKKTEELGVCPVSTHAEAHGINNGINGGRACWAIEGTLCGGEVQGTFAQKMGSCMKCDFYNQVRQDEGPGYKNSREIIKQLNGSHKTSLHKNLQTESPITNHRA